MNVWSKFLPSPLEFAAFVDAIDSPWAGVYFDVGNVLRTGFPGQWIRILGSRTARVQVKDHHETTGRPDGFVALPEGDVNRPAVREALEATGYDSWITADV